MGPVAAPPVRRLELFALGASTSAAGRGSVAWMLGARQRVRLVAILPVRCRDVAAHRQGDRWVGRPWRSGGSRNSATAFPVGSGPAAVAIRGRSSDVDAVRGGCFEGGCVEGGRRPTASNPASSSFKHHEADEVSADLRRDRRGEDVEAVRGRGETPVKVSLPFVARALLGGRALQQWATGAEARLVALQDLLRRRHRRGNRASSHLPEDCAQRRLELQAPIGLT